MERTIHRKHHLLQVAKKSTGSRDVLLVSTERILSGSTPKTTKPAVSTSWHSISSDENDGPASDASPTQYFKYGKDDSTPPRYTLVRICENILYK